jgi:hypothetical protein
MRTLLSLALAAVFAACSGSHRDEEPDASPIARESAAADLQRSRCALRDPVSANAREMLSAPWVERGASGPRLFAHVQDQDLLWAQASEGGETLPTSIGREPGAFAWTGSRYVTLSWREPTRDYVDSVAAPRVDHRVEVRDGQFQNPRAARVRLPGSTCSARLTAMAQRVLLTWRQRHGRTCEDGGGSGWYQVLDANGDPLTTARPLTVGHDKDESHPPLESLSARWDFGRAVVTAQRSGLESPFAWVLAPDGEVLWSGPAEHASGASEHVVCPRAGCFRVRDNRENSTDEQDSTATTLQFDRIGGSGFRVSAVMRGVRAAVVSGDRVLLLHVPPQNVTGCGLSVIDAGRRAVVLDEHDGNMTCEESSAVATPRGFQIAALEPSRGAFTRAIDCVW